MHRHNFVAPESLGFDSDGSVLVCDKPNCTVWKLPTKKHSLFTEKRFAVVMGIFSQALIVAVPFITGDWIIYVSLPIWAYLDYSVIKDWFHCVDSSEGEKHE